jgi:hypothetical protein
MARPLGPGGIDPIGNPRDKGMSTSLATFWWTVADNSDQHRTFQTLQTRLWTRTIVSSGCSITDSSQDSSIVAVEVMGS